MSLIEAVYRLLSIELAFLIMLQDEVQVFILKVGSPTKFRV
ncbi:MAG: hypothetical protein PUC61_05510 [Bacteroidales bacterium]|nr:hypothetical protein [Bacteroidales bacterium]